MWWLLGEEVLLVMNLSGRPEYQAQDALSVASADVVRERALASDGMPSVCLNAAFRLPRKFADQARRNTEDATVGRR